MDEIGQNDFFIAVSILYDKWVFDLKLPVADHLALLWFFPKTEYCRSSCLKCLTKVCIRMSSKLGEVNDGFILLLFELSRLFFKILQDYLPYYLLVHLLLILILYLGFESKSIKRSMFRSLFVKSASDKVLRVAFATNVVNAAAFLFDVVDSLFSFDIPRVLLHLKVFVFFPLLTH